MSEYPVPRRGADIDTLRRAITRLTRQVEDMEARRLTEEEALRTVERRTEAARKSGEEEENVRLQQIQALKKEILQGKNETAQRFSASLRELEDRITAQVTAQTETANDMGELTRRLESIVSQNAGEITALFTRQEQVRDAVQTLTDTQSGYQRFSARGMELGQAGSPFTVLLGNDRLSFLENGTEIASVSGSSMRISSARVADELGIGGVAFADNGTALVLK